jgi:hypothetical protein
MGQSGHCYDHPTLSQVRRGFMTTLSVDVERWAEKMGVAPLVLTYFDLENERRFDEWHQLLADNCVQTAAFDGSMPETVLLGDRIDYTVSGCKMDCQVKWVIEVEPRVAVFELDIKTWFEDGEEMMLDAIVKFEFNEELKLEHATAYYLQPGRVARNRERILPPEIR